MKKPHLRRTEVKTEKFSEVVVNTDPLQFKKSLEKVRQAYGADRIYCGEGDSIVVHYIQVVGTLTVYTGGPR